MQGRCEPVDTVPDCERHTPAARPLAIVRSASGQFDDLDLQSLSAWDHWVYFTSEGEVRRVSDRGGPVESLGAPGGPVGHSSLTATEEGAYVTWGSGVYELRPGHGPRRLRDFPIVRRRSLAIGRSATLVVHDDDTHTRTVVGILEGKADELLVLDGANATIVAHHYDFWIANDRRLTRLGKTGEVAETFELQLGVAPSSLEKAANVVFGAVEHPEDGLYRLDSPSELLLEDAHLANLTADFAHQALFAYGAMGTNGEDGGIFRIDPLTLAVTRLADADDAWADGNASWAASGLTATSEQVFFLERCQSPAGQVGEYRLVTLGL